MKKEYIAAYYELMLLIREEFAKWKDNQTFTVFEATQIVAIIREKGNISGGIAKSINTLINGMLNPSKITNKEALKELLEYFEVSSVEEYEKSCGKITPCRYLWPRYVSLDNIPWTYEELRENGSIIIDDYVFSLPHYNERGTLTTLEYMQRYRTKAMPHSRYKMAGGISIETAEEAADKERLYRMHTGSSQHSSNTSKWMEKSRKITKSVI